MEPGRRFYEAKRARLARFKHYRDDMMGYAQFQGTRPKTLGYALTDSPVGHLAWVPTGVAVSQTQDVTIRRWAARENNIVHWTELLVRDVVEFFRPLTR